MEKATFSKKFLSAGITRIILGIIISLFAFIISQKLISNVLESTSLDRNFRNLIKGIVSSAVILFAYILFYKKREKREITELSSNYLGKNLLLGVLTGIVLQGFTILVVVIFGNFKILSINPISAMIVPFTVAFSVAVFEEILMRGIIFRIIEEKLGSNISLFISSLIFALLHIANPNSTVISGLCVLAAGFLFGSAYLNKRNLWFPIAIHFAWNFVQSGILGAVTSGNDKTSSLLTSELTGNEMLTGGAFGPEGSVQAVVLCLIAAVVLFLNSKKNHIQPYWKK